MEMRLSTKTLEKLLVYQANEATAVEIYRSIAKFVKDDGDRTTLLKIANEEYGHYNIWAKYTRKTLKADKMQVFFYTAMARLFGYTFAIKLMEKNENIAVLDYGENPELLHSVPELATVGEEEAVHEQRLIGMLDEEKLRYVGSIVLGLNDALVEISGSLAGFTFAMGSNRLISMAGLITGISATLSMASSEYLSNRSEGNSDAVKSSIYTGFAYLITVALMIAPFLIFPDDMPYQALAVTMLIVVAIIFVFNFYLSVAKDYNFKKRFFEMAFISLGVAGLSFFIGIIVKNALGIEL